NLIKEEILKIRENGGTVIFSTHNMASVEELCDHIALINQSEKILEGRVRDIKNTYKNNLYEVCFSEGASDIRSFLPSPMTLESVENEEDCLKAKIKLMPGSGPNDLLSVLIPHVEVHSLHEIIPTMNDIFITTVNQYKHHHSTNPAN
ncbi:MAG: DUF4162 domain-containing protein, partial [Bacteroidetes bacterium]|nr:DUF4162 domain-containing protein [Bacteroidota bacterium]